MSSECWVEPGSESQGKQSRQEEQQREIVEEHVEVTNRDNEPAGGGGREWPSSPDRSGVEDVTSEGVLKQVQKEEMQTRHEKKRFSRMAVMQGSQYQRSGACQVQRYLPTSFPRDLQTHSRKMHSDRQCQDEEPRGPGPFYFIGGANGANIVSTYCESKGWKRIYNRHRKDFKLKWCETKSPFNYCNFREGEQLVYQIPNNKVLTTKIGLLSSLRDYDRVCSKVSFTQRPVRRLKMEEFIPTTFRMDVMEEIEAFFAQQEAVSNKCHMWICKPTGLNQGRGIFLLKNQEDIAAFRLKLQKTMEEGQAKRKMHHQQPQARIVQQYIQNPLLLEGKKFDVRSYLLIACTVPYMVFFRHGYVRLTCDFYDPNSNDLSAHLTNQYMQKKNPLYSQLKEDTVWSMESFNVYVNDRFQVAKGLPRDWVLGTFAKRMQQIMTQCFFAVKSKLHCRLGFFDLIGCDFMVDEDFKVWLLEMNCNPALHTNCEVLKEVIPRTVVETLDLTLEIFNKCNLRQKITPLASQTEFVLLYNAAPESTADSKFHPKTLKKTQRSEHRQSKLETRCKNVSGEGGSHLKSGHYCSTFAVPSPLHVSSPSLQGFSHLHSSINSTQAVREKNPRPRAEVKLSKCILHYHVKAAHDPKHSKTQQTRIMMSLSSSAVTEGSTACGSPEKKTLPPDGGSVGRPVSVDKHEVGQKTSEEELRDDTKS